MITIEEPAYLCGAEIGTLITDGHRNGFARLHVPFAPLWALDVIQGNARMRHKNADRDFRHVPHRFDAGRISRVEAPV